jgi:hypothetical protein
VPAFVGSAPTNKPMGIKELRQESPQISLPLVKRNASLPSGNRIRIDYSYFYIEHILKKKLSKHELLEMMELVKISSILQNIYAGLLPHVIHLS